ncbi:hypothetical protein N4R57_05155 [Rhodobacteraceae bacterium D3-12]|nr:hypothetical protein N4R57_05155 [Rhodobacteraceae bacterium D3-12]
MFRHPLNPRPLSRATKERATPARSAMSDELMSLCLKAQFQALIERTAAPDCGCLAHYDHQKGGA